MAVRVRSVSSPWRECGLLDWVNGRELRANIFVAAHSTSRAVANLKSSTRASDLSASQRSTILAQA